MKGYFMYTNENNPSSIKVYPNKEAIKQMTFRQSSLQAPLPNNVTPPKENSSEENFRNDDDFFTFLIFLIMFSDCADNDASLFTVILSMLFLY